MKTRKTIVGLLIAILVIASMALTGCGGGGGEEAAENEVKNPGEPIILATMTDDESQIFGEIMKQLLEAKGYEVNSDGVGTYNNTTLPRQSLQQKQIDITMDYTGRGMMFIEDVDVALYQKDLETAFNTTKEADEANGLVWMAYAPYNNTDTVCVSRAWAEENGVKDFNDLAAYLKKGGEFKLALDPDYGYYLTAPTCLPGWEETYGFKLSEDQIVNGVADPASKVADGTDGITASNSNGTNGILNALDLVNIEDPEIVAPVYSPAPVATAEVLEKYPELAEILAPAFENMTLEKILEYNKRLATDGEAAADIAKEYLEETGMI